MYSCIASLFLGQSLGSDNKGKIRPIGLLFDEPGHIQGASNIGLFWHEEEMNFLLHCYVFVPEWIADDDYSRIAVGMSMKDISPNYRLDCDIVSLMLTRCPIIVGLSVESSALFG